MMTLVDSILLDLRDLGLLPLLCAWVVTLFAATVQGTLGMGFAILSVPVLSAIDPRLAPVPQLLVVLPLTLGMAMRERHALNIRSIFWAVLGRFPGAGLGAACLLYASPKTLNFLIGGLVLVFSVLLGSRKIHLKRNPYTEFVMGAASATSAVVSSIGGPPMAMLFSRETGAEIRSNLGLIFSFGILLTLAVRIGTDSITSTDVAVAMVILPALLIGFTLSLWTKGRFEEKRMHAGLMTLCALSSIILLVKTYVT